ncbi:MAG: hypothetical protein EOP58_05475, partial [Sphingomonadales bacterium]
MKVLDSVVGGRTAKALAGASMAALALGLLAPIAALADDTATPARDDKVPAVAATTPQDVPVVQADPA